MASDDDGRPIPDAVEAYRRADRLDPYGFSGWIGREPHGASRSDSGVVRDGVFAEQVVDLFGELAGARRDGPWLAVASFVNPHDIAGVGRHLGAALGPGPDDDSVPEIPEAPSQSDSFAGRPPCQEAVQGRLVADALRAAARRGLPTLLPLPPQAGRPGHWADPGRPRVARAWPTTRSSCSPPTTATWWEPTAGCSRSGTTPTTRPSGCPVRRQGSRGRPGARRGHRRRPATSTSSRPCWAWPGSTSSGPPRGRPSTMTRPTRCPGRDLSGLHRRARSPRSRWPARVYFMTEDDVGPGSQRRTASSGEPFVAGGPAVPCRVGDRPPAHRARRGSRALEAEPLLRAPRRVATRPTASRRTPSPRRRQNRSASCTT